MLDGMTQKVIQHSGRLRKTCSVDECDTVEYARSWCKRHYTQITKYGEIREPEFKNPPCAFAGCKRRSSRGSYCRPHALEVLGPRKTAEGYSYGKKDNPYRAVYCPGHPNCFPSTRGYVPEHVKVMSEILGRALYLDENVHHKNGVRNDNRPDNLELWSVSQPAGQRVEDKLVWAREIIERYGEGNGVRST